MTRERRAAAWRSHETPTMYSPSAESIEITLVGALAQRRPASPTEHVLGIIAARGAQGAVLTLPERLGHGPLAAARAARGGQVAALA